MSSASIYEISFIILFILWRSRAKNIIKEVFDISFLNQIVMLLIMIIPNSFKVSVEEFLLINSPNLSYFWNDISWSKVSFIFS